MEHAIPTRVEVGNVPSGFNEFKMKSRLKQKCDGIDINVKNDDDGRKIFEITFKSLDEAKAFVETGISVKFGGKSHELLCRIVHNKDDVPDVPHESTYEADIVVDCSNEPYTWSSLWEQYGRMPIAPGTKCVIVADTDQSENCQTLRLYFENKRRSGGAQIKNMFKMTDGILIQYEDKTVAETVASRKQHLKEKDIKVFHRTVPGISKRKLLLENVPKETDQGTIELFLEACDKPDERPPTLIVNGHNNGQYMVTYDKDMDLIKLTNKISHEKLNGSAIQSRIVPESNCVQISGELKSVSNDAIRLNFENFRRSSGGDVTLVQRCGDNIALVYFAECQVAERVVDRWQEEGFIINKIPIKISIYYHALFNHHLNVKPDVFSPIKEPKPASASANRSESFSPNQNAKPFTFHPKVPTVMDFLAQSQHHYSNFEKSLDQLAEVKAKFNKQKKLIGILVTPLKNQGLPAYKFEEDCTAQLENFFNCFDAAVVKLESTQIKVMRERNKWTNNEDLITLSSATSTVSVFARWKTASVEIVGLVEEVKKANQILLKLTKDETRVFSLKQSDFKKFTEAGCFEKMQSSVRGMTISPLENSHSIEVIGPKENLQRAHTEILMALQALEESKIRNIEEMKRKYLESELQSEKVQPGTLTGMNIRAFIQAKFAEQKVHASLQLKDDELVLYYDVEKSRKAALDILEKFILSVRISIEGQNQLEALSTPEWKSQQQQICATGSRRIFLDKKAMSITISGLTSNVGEGKVKILQFLENNVINTIVIESSFLRQRFFLEYDKATQHKLGKVNYKATGKTDICLEGKKSDMAKAEALIERQLEKYIELQWTVHDPGMPEHFRSPKGKAFLTQTEQKTNCIIMIEEEQEIEKSKLETPTHAPVQAIYCAKVPNSQAVLHVYKDDITEHVCDAILNASNPELNLLPGGVSGAIQTKGGKSIQKQMHEITNKRGNLFAGEAASTLSGSLHNCQVIIHAVGPRWHENSHSQNCKYLQSCISSAMEEAEKKKLSSVAIPAISCGVFGGQPETCVPLIVETVLDYFKQHRESSIMQVDFVELQSDSVLDEFKKALSTLEQIEQPSMTKNGALPKTGPYKTRKVQTGKIAQSDTLTLGNISVAVCQGDITTDQSDAIVNSTNSSFDLTQGMVSRAILQKGGPTILQECNNRSGPVNTQEMRITNAGNLRCRYVCHIVTPKSIKDIGSILVKVFQNVDRLGITSLAIPALGTGNLRLGGEKVAKCFRRAIEEYVNQNTPMSLKSIKVVIFEKKMVSDFRQGLFAENKEKSFTSKFWGGIWKMMGADEEQQMETLDPKKQIRLHFCSDTQSNIDEAKKAINDHMKENSASQPLEDEAIERLDPEDKQDIMELQNKHGVEIRDVSNQFLKRFVIKGLDNNVLKAKNDALDIIRAFKEGETCSRYVTWSYVDTSKSLTKFSNRVNAALEQAYMANKNGKEVVLTRDRRKLEVSFRDWQGNYEGSTDTTEIARQDKTEEQPSGWTNMNDNVDKILVKPGTQEYIQVMDKFNASGPFNRQYVQNNIMYNNSSQTAPTVVTLERIQHKSQYKQFVAKKNEVTERMKKSNNTAKVVKELFHGTSFDVAEKIYVQGFDRGYAGANATVYGKGVYFATNATYSNKYAPPHQTSNHRKMFLADVVTGEFCQGNQSLISPPPRSNATNRSELYDSVVDNINNPTIFVVFKDASAYPKYLLTYTV